MMAGEQRLTCDPYQAVYETAQQRILQLAVKVGTSPGAIRESFNVWAFLPVQEISSLSNLTSPQSVDFVWRAAH
jgi:hypothetical protein